MLFKFTVRGDRIIPERTYDFIEGNKGSYEAWFTFSEEWKDRAKVCVVEQGEKVYTIVITDGGCFLPEMERGTARIGVIGTLAPEDGEATTISTNMQTIGVLDGAAGKEVNSQLNTAAEVWEQYLSKMEECRKETISSSSEAKDTLENVKGVAQAAEESKNAAEHAVKKAGEAVQEAQTAADNAAKEAREAVKETVQEAQTAADNAKSSKNSALTSSNQAKKYAEEAEGHSKQSESFAKDANSAADKAENAISHNPVIVDGYWHIWSVKHGEYINTNVKAQAGSEVYIGDNPPDSADIIIDLDGESAIYAPYIGENGNWYTFNPETQAFADSGNKAVAKDGYTPVKGEDYWTPEEEAEMRNSINSAVEDATASAEEAQKSAQQALADLLAMINGGDIILATNGKLPLSAIPATATQEIYTVSSEDELTSLTAQRGDLAELIEEVDGEQTITKTWQCLGDASVRENWVVWGTSYAVQSGNATTANNALNANMINNHRIVEMTEEEFASAVKDENTYYLVY